MFYWCSDILIMFLIIVLIILNLFVFESTKRWRHNPYSANPSATAFTRRHRCFCTTGSGPSRSHTRWYYTSDEWKGSCSAEYLIHNITVLIVVLFQAKLGVPLLCTHVVEGHNSSVLSLLVNDNILYTGAVGNIKSMLVVRLNCNSTHNFQQIEAWKSGTWTMKHGRFPSSLTQGPLFLWLMIEICYSPHAVHLFEFGTVELDTQNQPKFFVRPVPSTRAYRIRVCYRTAKVQ